jgi:hypothetical protein
MTPTEALAEAARAGRYRQFDVSSHALKRMKERNVTRRDIGLALASATTAKFEGGTKWRVEGGRDDAGDPLGVVIAFTGRGLVVTVF